MEDLPQLLLLSVPSNCINKNKKNSWNRSFPNDCEQIYVFIIAYTIIEILLIFFKNLKNNTLR